MKKKYARGGKTIRVPGRNAIISDNLKTLRTLKLGVLAAAMASSPLIEAAEQADRLNTTQSNAANAIEVLCPLGTRNNAADFQSRCNALVGANGGLPQFGGPELDGTTDPGLINAFQQVAPEQIISQGTNATKTSINIFGARLTALRLGARGLSLAGQNFNRSSGNAFANMTPSIERGGSAGDGTSPWERLSVFVNGNYNFGNADSTFNQVGFDYDSGGVVAGMDYRFTDDLILGAGFNYNHMEADFDRNGGELDSDQYSGVVYGTYYLPDGFYADGIATFGGIDYDSSRRIQYTVPESVITTATGETDAWQYSVSGGFGYNHAVGEWTINPYVQASYINLDVDGFTESEFSPTGTTGWAMGFQDQEVESVITTIGTQISYALSTSYGVFLPYIRGEWQHQYEDSSRDITVRFVGDRSRRLPFSTVTESPDRNYFTLGTGISGTFAHGITGFFNYDALLGYDDIESHVFTVGARMPF